MNPKYIILILGLAAIMSSCLKDITDLNTDPNNPQSVDPQLLFKYSIKSLFKYWG